MYLCEKCGQREAGKGQGLCYVCQPIPKLNQTKQRTSPFLPHTLLHAVDAYIEEHPKCRCLVREMADDHEGSATLTHGFTLAHKRDLLMTLLSDLEINGCIQGNFTISDLLAADGDQQRLDELIATTTDEDANG